MTVTPQEIRLLGTFIVTIYQSATVNSRTRKDLTAMGIYKPPHEFDSNPDRVLRQAPRRGILFMICFVYLPLTIVAIFGRALMLLGGYKVIDLTVVDEFVRHLMLQFQNFFYYY